MAKAISKRAPFELEGVEIKPGSRQLVPLTVAELHAHDAPLVLPVHVIHGQHPGPTIFVTAAVHGDELNGVEIVRRLLRQRALNRLSGTLLAIPVVNGLGFMQRSRYLPDGRDLNRSFPGSTRGSVAARLAHRLFHGVLKRCDYGIDLHTAAAERDNLPQIRANLDDPKTRELALAFGVAVAMHSQTRDGSLREAAADEGVPTLLFEAGRALHFSEFAIRSGLRGILRILRHIEMLPRAPAQQKPQAVFEARASRWLRAPRTGAVVLKKELGTEVAAGDTVAEVFDPYDLFNGSVEPLVAAEAGIVVGINRGPVVYEGDAVVHVAEHEAASDIAEQVEAERLSLLTTTTV